MPRKPSREQVERDLQNAHETVHALRLFVKALSPAKGWRFVVSPRGWAAFLIQIDETAGVNVYSFASKGPGGCRLLLSELYRVADADGTLESFLDADKLAWEWLAKSFQSWEGIRHGR